MNVLITGASGFVGGFIVASALNQEWKVYAAVRSTSSRKYLTDDRIGFVDLDLTNEAAISAMLANFKEKHGNIDYVIHNAGISKTTDISLYDRVNFRYTVSLIKCLERSDHIIKKFTFISSMAAAGPGSELTYTPITTDDVADPVTAYGWSKKKAETFIEQECQLPYVILRPPPVFGPRDKDMFTIFEVVNKGLELYVGSKSQKLSFVYVKDLANGIIAATKSSVTNVKFFLSDNQQYDGELFHNLVKKALNKKTVKLNLPLFIVYFVAFFSELITKITGKDSQLNLEKIKELKCLNWVCDSGAFYATHDFRPAYTLESAVKETADWYKKEGWLK